MCMYCGLLVEARGQLSGLLFSCFIGSRDQSQVIRFGGKCLKLLSHLIGPRETTHTCPVSITLLCGEPFGVPLGRSLTWAKDKAKGFR